MTRPCINQELRRLVIERADSLCEYCLVPDAYSSISHQVDHIVSVKHGGSTVADNLCYSCIFCNLQKGSDLGSINWQTGELVRFFNPRRDKWNDYFRLDGVIIQPLTDIGKVTARIFKFNSKKRIAERQTLVKIGVYPPPSVQENVNRENE